MESLNIPEMVKSAVSRVAQWVSHAKPMGEMPSAERLEPRSGENPASGVGYDGGVNRDEALKRQADDEDTVHTGLGEMLDTPPPGTPLPNTPKAS